MNWASLQRQKRKEEINAKHLAFWPLMHKVNRSFYFLGKTQNVKNLHLIQNQKKSVNFQ